MNISQLKKEVKQTLLENILPYWMDKMIDNDNGGFYGRIDSSEHIDKKADKGAVLNARLLWTFSAAYRVTGEKKYLEIATRAKDYYLKNFVDKEHGGVYWSLDYKGKPKETKKQTYATGFAIYGLSEYARAVSEREKTSKASAEKANKAGAENTGKSGLAKQSAEAAKAAILLYNDLIKHAHDKKHGGYYEALTREWKPIKDTRLSDKDENVCKSMNTHLHIIEPFANLYRIYPDIKLREQIEHLLDVFANKIVAKNGHQQLFFSREWNPTSQQVSYGHDIEAAWLLYEAAEVIGQTGKVKKLVKHIAQAAVEVYVRNQGMLYESNPMHAELNAERHWWVQAETVVGCAKQYKIFKDTDKMHAAKMLQVAIETWDFIKQHLLDTKNGEWFWSILPNGAPDKKQDKAGFWKCPYHNSRMCIEIFFT
jgi:mannobiose 2-epimerase